MVMGRLPPRPRFTPLYISKDRKTLDEIRRLREPFRPLPSAESFGYFDQPAPTFTPSPERPPQFDIMAGFPSPFAQETPSPLPPLPTEEPSPPTFMRMDDFKEFYYQKSGWGKIHRGVATRAELEESDRRLREMVNAYNTLYGARGELKSAGIKLLQLFPIAATVVDWSRMSPAERAISVAVDVAILATPAIRPVGRALKGAPRAVRAGLQRIPVSEVGGVRLPKGKPTPPTAPMATNWQKIEAHNIAKRKALIDAKGKMKPQYRRFAKAMTGKSSMLQMTEEEAGFFVRALKGLPEATFKGRKKIPPRIPITKRVVEEKFFDIKFGEPTPARLFTSQTYYSQKLGVKPLTEPLELAKQRFDLEFQAWSNAVDKKIIEIDKLAGTSIKEKAAATLKNRPTKAVERMRNLLDKFEDPPPDLNPKEVEIFRWFRNTSRTLLEGENQVRRALGMEEIPHRMAYVRHVADNTAKEVLEGTHPLPEALKFWSQRIVGKKIFNPMEMQRQLSDDLAEYFSKDLAYTTKSMLNTGLKEIHLSQPLEAFKQMMGAYSAKMPASTQRWVTDFINQVIKGQQTAFDAEINRLVTQTGVGSLFNKMLVPFGRTIGRKPLTDMAQLMGRATILSVMTPRPGLAKMIIRNLFQHVQDMALYGIRASLKAYQPAKGTLKELLDESLFLKGYTGFEELPVKAMAKMERLALKPYGASAVFNAKTGMKTAYHATEPWMTNPKYKNLGWANPKRTYTEPKDFFYPSERELLLKEMEFGAGITQYSYIPMGMPEIFRHKALTPLTRLQSWWMNHFFKFHREAMGRALSGRTSQGMNLPWTARVNYLKYLTLGGGILTSMGYERAFLLGVLPYNMSPVGQFMIGSYNFTTAKTDRQRDRAKRTILNSWRAFVPGSLAWKEVVDVWSGKRPLSSIFFYGDELPPKVPTFSIPLPEEKDVIQFGTKGAPKETKKTREEIQFGTK